MSRACAIGVICAFTPWPLQMLQGAVFAIIFRAHLPLSVSIVWISNPITIPFFLIMVYMTGAAALGMPLSTEHIEWTLEWFYNHQADIWLPILMGCLLHAVFWSALLHRIVFIIWRNRVRHKWKVRHTNKK